MLIGKSAVSSIVLDYNCVYDNRIKQDLLPLATSLCQDVDFEVRSCMCCQLDPIARRQLCISNNVLLQCYFLSLKTKKCPQCISHAVTSSTV